jgi:hypothetical protein
MEKAILTLDPNELKKFEKFNDPLQRLLKNMIERDPLKRYRIDNVI